MTDVHRVLRSFSESRYKYPDVDKAVDEVCESASLDKQSVLCILEMAGVYVLPDSEIEKEIRVFIASMDKDVLDLKDLTRNVASRFMISSKEAARLTMAFSGKKR